MVMDTFWALIVGVLSVAMLSDTTMMPEGVSTRLVLLWLLGGSVLPLVWRRTYPDAAIAVVALGCGVQLFLLDTVGPNNIAALMMLYAVAAYGRREWAPWWLALALLGLVIGNADWTWNASFEPPDGAVSYYFVSLTGTAALAVACFVPGMLKRNRKELIESLRERAESLERERDSTIRLAAQEERNRIAREMHDVVAHSLSVIVVQADGASYALGRNEPQASAATAVKALRTIGDTARNALVETRRLVGVLRQDGDIPDYEPAATIARVEELVANVREAGTPAELVVRGDETWHEEPDAATQMAIYRVVQESLTNTLKHAGPGAAATVEIEHRPEDICVTVRDTGPGTGTNDGRGHGLVGMRERVNSLQGEFVARTRLGGGFEVLVRLPVLPARPGSRATRAGAPGARTTRRHNDADVP